MRAGQLHRPKRAANCSNSFRAFSATCGAKAQGLRAWGVEGFGFRLGFSLVFGVSGLEVEGLGLRVLALDKGLV